ncbi:restriction endonuclease subunit S [Neisseria sicca]|uniref:restriction endonuclease subunit S n=1 Tax=Neisseria sicca TaxID=490 RepID=UPI0011BD036C|nr:restriction endonuclease subunit S [Neisseria sicca]
MTTEQQLPEGWKIERLGDIAISEKGKKPKNQSSKKTDKFCYPYVDIEAFEKGIIKSYTDGAKCVLCDENDFLMVWDGARSGLVGKGIKGALGSTLVRILLPNINNLYAYYFLLSKYKEINTRAKGSGTPHVDPDLLWNYAFPIPPNQETQQAIVNKIESLFDEIDEGIGRLKTAAQQIQQYRQSLLKNAFNGELTKEWRSKHADALPSENELLAQIQTAREQHHAQQLADWQTAVSQWEQNGKEGKKPSKPKAPTQAVKFEENVADLPSGWGMVKLENLASEYVLGKMLDKNKNKGKERLYLGNINVRWGYFEFSNAKTMKIEDDEIERYSVKYGDLIICEGGEPGRCAVWKHEAEMFIQKALHRVRFPSYYSADFAFYYLSYAVKLPLVTDLLTGTTIKHLTGTALKNIPFPVCSINEQTQIVAILESKLTACDQLAAELAKQLKQAELLKQAVLKAAFSGSLLDK